MGGALYDATLSYQAAFLAAAAFGLANLAVLASLLGKQRGNFACTGSYGRARFSERDYNHSRQPATGARSEIRRHNR